jgi:hypothetical protein
MPMATGSAKQLRRVALAGGVILALACGHTDPFSSTPYGTDQPFSPTPPVRLTLNEGPDRGASWLPDGTGILYSTQQNGRQDDDVCLAELPPTGGSQRRLICDLSALDGAVTNDLEFPVVGADGRLAFVNASGKVGAVSPDRLALAVAPGLDASAATEVQPIPYAIGGEPRHNAVAQLHWQRENLLIYVGGTSTFRVPCLDCEADTVFNGLKAVLLDLSSGAGPVAVPGTDFASGVTPGVSGDEVLYTLVGDTRVFRRVLSTGEVSVAHDFGAAGIARDVHVAGGHLAAIVGGRVAFSVDPELGPTQWDSGGIVHVVDLSSGSDVALPGPGLFRRPALAPGGDRVVAEGYPLIIFTPVGGTARDTLVSRTGDLYLFGLP